MKKTLQLIQAVLLVSLQGCRTPSAPHTPTLIDAVRSGNLAEVHRHLEMGADVNQLDGDGFTPLLWACVSLRDNSDVVALLLENGADVKAMDHHGFTALDDAVQLGNLRSVSLLIGKGADVNAKDGNGHTPLMWAVCVHRFEVVTLLVDKGADVNIRASIDGSSALGMAVGRGYTEIAEYLRTHGARE